MLQSLLDLGVGLHLFHSFTLYFEYSLACTSPYILHIETSTIPHLTMSNTKIKWLLQVTC